MKACIVFGNVDDETNIAVTVLSKVESDCRAVSAVEQKILFTFRICCYCCCYCVAFSFKCFFFSADSLAPWIFFFAIFSLCSLMVFVATPNISTKKVGEWSPMSLLYVHFHEHIQINRLTYACICWFSIDSIEPIEWHAEILFFLCFSRLNSIVQVLIHFHCSQYAAHDEDSFRVAVATSTYL